MKKHPVVTVTGRAGGQLLVNVSWASAVFVSSNRTLDSLRTLGITVIDDPAEYRHEENLVRIEMLAPREMSRSVLRDALSLTGTEVSDEALSRWTKLELAIAYDWAMRVHLKASDSRVRLRDKPSFVTAAELSRDAS